MELLAAAALRWQGLPGTCIPIAQPLQECMLSVAILCGVKPLNLACCDADQSRLPPIPQTVMLRKHWCAWSFVPGCIL